MARSYPSLHRTVRRPILVLLLVVAVAAGCRGGANVGAGPETSLSSEAAAPPLTTVTTVTTVTTGVPVTAETTPTTGPTATSRPPSSSGRVASTRTTSARPRVVVPEQGDRLFAVFVATGSSLSDPSFAKAKSRLAALGYPGSTGGDTACSRGAKEALPGLRAYSMSLEFGSRADAERFAGLYGRVIGIALVTVYCVD